MPSFLNSALIIGGLLPCLLFGVFNLFYKPVASKLSLVGMVSGMVLGGMLTVMAYSAWMGEKGWGSVGTGNWWMAVGLGVLWGIANIGLVVGLGVLGGNTSQIIPLVNVNTLITVLLVWVFTPEPVVAWKVGLGALLIVAGAWLVVRA